MCIAHAVNAVNCSLKVDPGFTTKSPISCMGPASKGYTDWAYLLNSYHKLIFHGSTL